VKKFWGMLTKVTKQGEKIYKAGRKNLQSREKKLQSREKKFWDCKQTMERFW